MHFRKSGGRVQGLLKYFFAVADGIVMVSEVGFMETSYLSASAIAKKIAGLIQLDSETVLVFSLMVFSSMFLINLSNFFSSSKRHKK